MGGWREGGLGCAVVLPNSALDDLTRLAVQYPMLFRIYCGDRVLHVGVSEFSAQEGQAYLPSWVMKELRMVEGTVAEIANVSLPKCTFVKLRPHSSAFLDLTNPKAALEYSLRSYSCLTQGRSLCIQYNHKDYWMEVVESRPAAAVTIIETDTEVDFAPPLDYVEPSSSRGAAGAASGGGSSSSSSSGAAALAGLHSSGGGGVRAHTHMDGGHLVFDSDNDISATESGLSGPPIQSIPTARAAALYLQALKQERERAKHPVEAVPRFVGTGRRVADGLAVPGAAKSPGHASSSSSSSSSLPSAPDLAALARAVVGKKSSAAATPPATTAPSSSSAAAPSPMLAPARLPSTAPPPIPTLSAGGKLVRPGQRARRDSRPSSATPTPDTKPSTPSPAPPSSTNSSLAPPPTVVASPPNKFLGKPQFTPFGGAGKAAGDRK
jgi:Ubiquitin fusion degradation protein UFD1